MAHDRASQGRADGGCSGCPGAGAALRFTCRARSEPGRAGGDIRRGEAFPCPRIRIDRRPCRACVETGGSRASLLDILQETDAPPTSQAVEASVLLQKDLGDLLARWEGIRKNQIAPMNEKLRASHFPALVAE
jgi:hypothetical protein